MSISPIHGSSGPKGTQETSSMKQAVKAFGHKFSKGAKKLAGKAAGKTSDVVFDVLSVAVKHSPSTLNPLKAIKNPVKAIKKKTERDLEKSIKKEKETKIQTDTFFLKAKTKEFSADTQKLKEPGTAKEKLTYLVNSFDNTKPGARGEIARTNQKISEYSEVECTRILGEIQSSIEKGELDS